MGQLPVNDAEEMKKLLNMFQSGDIEKTISEMQRLVMQDKVCIWSPLLRYNSFVSPPLPPTHLHPLHSLKPLLPPPLPLQTTTITIVQLHLPRGSQPPCNRQLRMLKKQRYDQLYLDSTNDFQSQLPADMDPSAMEKLMEQFENNKEFQAAMEGMVQQLIAKDTLYDPMKELRERVCTFVLTPPLIMTQYPVWLKENEKKLAVEDYQRYIKQYECVQKICTSYEKNGEDYQEVIALMQEVGYHNTAVTINIHSVFRWQTAGNLHKK